MAMMMMMMMMMRVFFGVQNLCRKGRIVSLVWHLFGLWVFLGA